MKIEVSTSEEFIHALEVDSVTEIVVTGTISGMPSQKLPAGVSLRGGVLRFGARGLGLTANNTLTDVRVEVPDHEVAIWNDTAVDDLGVLQLSDVSTIGQVLLVADDAVRRGVIHIDGLHIDRADLRGRELRPHGFGVDVQQGALTVWNRQPDSTVRLQGELLSISAGSPESPIRGSGVFAAGYGAGEGGTLELGRLVTGEVHTDGGIAPGTPDLISGAVFVVHGCSVRDVVNNAPVSTSGQNDMVLDNWGTVQAWTAEQEIVSTGPSGIGFVNFGRLDELDVQGPITTHGTGARGFNLYDGHVESARFSSITTHGPGAVGIQVSQPLTRIEVGGDVSTTGGRGTSLVKGVQVQLDAVAISIRPGAAIGSITVGGSVTTQGKGTTAIEIAGGLDRLDVAGRVEARGAGADAVQTDRDVAGLTALQVESASGRSIVHAAG